LELFLSSCSSSRNSGQFSIVIKSFLGCFFFAGDATKIDFQSLLSLADEGIDVSFLKASGKKGFKSHVCHVRRALT